MFASLLAWLFYLINPLTNLSARPIQPQLRLRPDYPSFGPWEDIITGVYGRPPMLKIHDRKGVVKWTWDRNDVHQNLPHQLQHCLKSKANDATEIKWTRNGTSIAAIYSDLVLFINHTPDNATTDKQITWAVCRQNEFLWNAHAIEPLPGDRVAVATTGQREWDGILVYNSSAANPLVDDPPVLQNITGLRAIHNMIWDDTEQMLWAAGTDYAADGSDGVPAHGTLQAYPYNATTGLLEVDDSLRFSLPEARDQMTEWGAEYGWWAGPHDLVPVPDQRIFLFSDDRDLHAFDINRRQFTEEGEAVVDKYLPGFQVTTNDRRGYNSKGLWEVLPRSDLKSFSLAPDGSFIYVQFNWRGFRGFHTNLVVDRLRRTINEGDEIYRSRFFGDIPGWRKPVT